MKRKKNHFAGILIGGLLIIALLSVLIFFGLEERKKALHPMPYFELVQKYSEEFDVPMEIIYAVMKTESSFNEKAVSRANAKGLMQLTDDTLDWITQYHLKTEGELDIFDPETNIMVGTYYLKYAYDRYKNWDTAYASYNAGIGRVDSWLKDNRYSNDGETLYYIPYKETREYVVKVNSALKVYKELYFNESEY